MGEGVLFLCRGVFRGEGVGRLLCRGACRGGVRVVFM